MASMERPEKWLCSSMQLAFICAFAGASLAKAAEAERILKDPPLIKMQRTLSQVRSAMMGATNKMMEAPMPHEAVLDLNVTFTNGQIWNPSSASYDKVMLRSYQGTDVSPTAPYVAPTIKIFPGETIRVTLNNKLPADSSCSDHGGDVNTPHCFNGTNLHSHGLWISPAGNSDNVLVSLNPGVSFQYEYNVPPDHPAGTFWYHPHRHGSTALQVASGMAGALIIQGTRPPTPTKNGDIDTLLKATSKQSFKERLLVMQQVQYACYDKDGKIKTNPDKTYRCDPGDVGEIRNYDGFGPGDWAESGRYTSINGEVLPTFAGAKAGQIERWRIVHAGIRDTINLQFRKLKEGVKMPTGLKATEHAAFVAANCSPATVPQFLMAADGLTMANALRTDVSTFQPGYRWDALLVFPTDGNYCVVDTTTPAAGNVAPTISPVELLGIVKVDKGQNVVGDITSYMTSQLVAAAQVNMPSDVRAKVSTELANKLAFTSFVPHPTITENEVTGTQELVFFIDTTTTPAKFEVNGKPYDPARIDRNLVLGKVDEWTLTSDFVSHPFHIHVNPFQIVKILDPSGKDVSGADAIDTAGGFDPQYRGLKGVWKDTLWVKNLSQGKPGRYTLVVRTRYERYIGEFVLHCHILDHEDQGMMQNVSIGVSDGKGGVARGHH